MNFLYIINYVIFAVFFTLFTLELGVALTFLKNKDEDVRNRLQKFIGPLWQLNGTFAVFYLVNFEATYPLLLNVVGYAYIIPLMVAALAFILRNAFISYSGYTSDPAKHDRYLKIYSLATLITYFLVASVFASAVSGIGINVDNASIEILSVLFNPFNIIAFAGLVLLGLFSVESFFGIRSRKFVTMMFGILSFGILSVAFAVYLPFLFQGSLALYSLAGLTIFIAIYLFSLLRGSGATRLFAIVWPLLVILSFGVVEYPAVFGNTASLLTYMTNSASGFWISVVSAVGGTLLVIYIAYFISAVYLKKPNGEGY